MSGVVFFFYVFFFIVVFQTELYLYILFVGWGGYLRLVMLAKPHEFTKRWQEYTRDAGRDRRGQA